MKLKAVKILVVTIFFLSMFMKIPQGSSNNYDNVKKLKFKSDGTFKIVQFTDIQDDEKIDNRTLNLMNKILDREQPDLVILTGDNTDGTGLSPADIKKAINNIAEPMEKRHIPWAVTFGNHDNEHSVLTKKEMMNIYMSNPYNISQTGPENIDGVGNYNLLINDSKGDKPIFNIYMLDSGTYAPKEIGGYDWIKFSQIAWYRNVSTDLRKQLGLSVPALMFFHIPLPEWKQGIDNGNLSGIRSENEGSSYINGGLFASLLEMGDVKGVFVGHDHTNDYIVDLYGIKLGYSRNVGYGTYGSERISRGARVFLIKEPDPSHFETWMTVETDFK